MPLLRQNKKNIFIQVYRVLMGLDYISYKGVGGRVWAKDDWNLVLDNEKDIFFLSFSFEKDVFLKKSFFSLAWQRVIFYF